MVEGRQRQNSGTTKLLSFLVFSAYTSMPHQQSPSNPLFFSSSPRFRRILQFLQGGAERFQASEHGALAQIYGQLGEAFAHGSHGRSGFLRLLPISDLIGAGDKAGKRKWDGVTDQNWKGMTEIMKKLGKGIIYIYSLIYMFLFI